VPAGVGAGSEASERERRERRERGEKRRTEGEEQPLSLPTSSLMASAEEDWGTTPDFLCSFFFLSFLCDFFSAHLIFLGQAWTEGKGRLATCRHHVGCGERTLYGSHHDISRSLSSNG